MIRSISHYAQVVSLDEDESYYKPSSTLVQFPFREDDSIIVITKDAQEWNSFEIAPLIRIEDLFERNEQDPEFFGVYTSIDGGEKTWVADFKTEQEAIAFVNLALLLSKSYRP